MPKYTPRHAVPERSRSRRRAVQAVGAATALITAGTATTGLATASATTPSTAPRSAANAAALAAHNTYGSVTRSMSGLTLNLRGNAHDPDVPWHSVRVVVTDGNRLLASTGTVGAHAQAFSARVHLAPGRHYIRVIAQNIGAGSSDRALATWAMLIGGGGRSTGRSAPVAVGSYSGNQRIAAAMLSAYSWGQDQMPYLVKLWNHESGWNASAANRSSGAYGIPQALPGGKMASAGADWRTNPATQIRWGLGYIKSRFGSPAAAWSHEVAYNWY